MTVSEFINILDTYCDKLHLINFTYKGEPTYMYKLKNNNNNLNNISFEYSLKEINKDEFTIESYTYNLNRLDKNDKQLYNSLYIEQPEGIVRTLLTINII